jgi:hypothetical protein
VTITTEEMTRFLLSLDQAVDTIFAALTQACAGETYVPGVPAARMTDVAKALIGDREVEIVFTGIRPGEKTHEILVSEEEAHRTIAHGDYFVILPILPELRPEKPRQTLGVEYSSADKLMTVDQCAELRIGTASLRTGCCAMEICCDERGRKPPERAPSWRADDLGDGRRARALIGRPWTAEAAARCRPYTASTSSSITTTCRSQMPRTATTPSSAGRPTWSASSRRAGRADPAERRIAPRSTSSAPPSGPRRPAAAGFT